MFLTCFVFFVSSSFFTKVCRAKIDLGFLIDGSGSIEAYGKGNFKRVLQFVKYLVGAFKVGRSKTRVGVILFSSRPFMIFRFNKYSTKSQVLRAISRIRYPRGGTKTGFALNYVKNYLFGKSSSRKKVLIVLTDGKSQDRVGISAKRLKSIGCTILSVGLGRKYNMRQLIQIASSRKHVYTGGFRTLNRMVRAIKRKVCKGMCV